MIRVGWISTDFFKSKVESKEEVKKQDSFYFRFFTFPFKKIRAIRVLLALVINKKEKNIVRLNASGIEEKINTLLLNSTTETVQLQALYDLYKMVWEPVSSFVQDKRVTIIPDGILYNLSFEMLAVKPLTSYKDLATGSLLTDHIFSYYSLLC